MVKERKRKPCPHGNYGYWWCSICQRPDKAKSRAKCKESNNKKARARYKELKKDPDALKKLREYHREWAKTPAGVLKYYRRNARDRNIEFKITKETIEKYWDDDCDYCGEQGRRGLDRINNQRGYFEDNMIPCCKTCNWMKMDMTTTEFYDKCRAIINTREELGYSPK